LGTWAINLHHPNVTLKTTSFVAPEVMNRKALNALCRNMMNWELKKAWNKKYGTDI
jgi:hypothetical protein